MKKKVILCTVTATMCIAAAAQDGLTDVQKAVAQAASAANNAPVTTAPAPKPKYWTTSLDVDLGFNQTALVNWAAGGSNTISLAAALDGKACYARDLVTWDNRLQLNYGFMWVQDNKLDPFQKSNDRIYLESIWARTMSEKSKWKYSASFDFRSQFADGFDYSKSEWIQPEGGEGYVSRVKTSSFMSPAYINLALGAGWVPCKWFDMSLAPVTGSVTIVTDASGNYALRAKYGMPSWTEPSGEGTATYYNAALFQIGAQIKANAHVNINDKFTFETQLSLFYDYLFNYKNEKFCKEFPVRTNWDCKLSWKIAKYFKLGLDTWLLFDPLVSFDNDQDPKAVGTHKVQFKEFFTINFAWSIDNLVKN